MVAAFARYQDTAASRLRYEQAQRNLEKLHHLGRPLRVLDAGGGNGINAAFLLTLGHAVTLYDSNPAMLGEFHARLADARERERCEVVEGLLEDVVERTAGRQFDLVLCHHVIEYMDDAARLLRALRSLAAPGAELSLVTLNPVSEVVRAIIFQKDARLASTRLDDLTYDARWFGKARLHAWEELVAWAEGAGWMLHDFRGIRVFADYMLKSEDTGAIPADLLALEDSVAGRDPYRRFGRYLQFCFKTHSR
jgi:S-adenosylmethionine-dependent methyltransferase